jgi:hypothetical protein
LGVIVGKKIILKNRKREIGLPEHSEEFERVASFETKGRKLLRGCFIKSLMQYLYIPRRFFTYRDMKRLMIFHLYVWICT